MDVDQAWLYNLIMIGKRIRLARTNKRLTLRFLGEAVGVSPQAVAQWEKSNPVFDALKAREIANVLDVNLDWLEGIIGNDEDVLQYTGSKDYFGRVPLINVEDALMFILISSKKPTVDENSILISPIKEIKGQGFAIAITKFEASYYMNEGDVAIFDNALTPKAGDIIIGLSKDNGIYQVVLGYVHDEPANKERMLDIFVEPLGHERYKQHVLASAGITPIAVLVEIRRFSKPWGSARASEMPLKDFKPRP